MGCHKTSETGGRREGSTRSWFLIPQRSSLRWKGVFISGGRSGNVTSSCWRQTLFHILWDKTLTSPFSTCTWASFKEKMGSNGRNPYGLYSCTGRVVFIGNSTRLAPWYCKQDSNLPTRTGPRHMNLYNTKRLWEKRKFNVFLLSSFGQKSKWEKSPSHAVLVSEGSYHKPGQLK